MSEQLNKSLLEQLRARRAGKVSHSAGRPEHMGQASDLFAEEEANLKAILQDIDERIEQLTGRLSTLPKTLPRFASVEDPETDAFKQSVNIEQPRIKAEIAKLKSLRERPYYARIRVIINGGKEVEYYIGDEVNIDYVEKGLGILSPWSNPAKMYRARGDKFFFETENGRMEFEVTKKIEVRIVGGKLEGVRDKSAQ